MAFNLESSLYANNTIVVLWSDHGYHLGEKQMTGKTTLWERSTRVPLIFAGPGIEPAKSDEPVELLDVYPTLADLAGLPSPESIDGRTLKPLIDDPSTKRERPAFTEHTPKQSFLRLMTSDRQCLTFACTSKLPKKL